MNRFGRIVYQNRYFLLAYYLVIFAGLFVVSRNPVEALWLTIVTAPVTLIVLVAAGLVGGMFK